MRDKFTFHTCWLEGLDGYSVLDQARVVLALMRYAAFDEVPDLEDNLIKVPFCYAREQIDKDNNRFKVGHNGGSKGGVSNNPYGRRGKPKEPSPFAEEGSVQRNAQEQRTNLELTKNYQETNLFCKETERETEKEKEIEKKQKIKEEEKEKEKEKEKENWRRINSAMSKDTTEVMSSDAEGAANEDFLSDKKLRHKLDKTKIAIEIQNYYNEQIKAKDARLRFCQSLSEKRIGLVSGRLAKFSIEEVKTVIDKAVGSHFLNYEASNAPVDFEWIMRPENFVKILEGKYEERTRTPSHRPGSNEGNKRVNDLW